MNKIEFMKKLAGLLAVLQEDEIRDILSEYEQHIDMKMESGLSEQEAIEDFGSVEELAADILAAYHVRTDCHKEPAKSREVIEKVTNGSKKACSSAGGFLKRIGSSISDFFKKCYRKGKEWCKKPFLWIQGIWNRDGQKERKEKSLYREGRGIIGRLVHFCARCCFAILFFFTGLITIFTLFGVGLLAVLALLGYPVLGILLTAIGCAISSGAVLFFSGIMMRRK